MIKPLTLHGHYSFVRVLSLRSSLFMVLWQSPDTSFLSCFLVRGFECTRAMLGATRTGPETRQECRDPNTTLQHLSTCSVSCWSVVFGSRHSCLVSGPVLVSCRGSDTYAPSLFLLWEHAVSSLLEPCAPLSVCIRCLCFAFSCFVCWPCACGFVLCESLLSSLPPTLKSLN